MGQIPMKNSLVASGRRQLLVLGLLALILLQTAPLRAELRRIEVRRRDDFGTYERIIGRAFFAVDPALAANHGIADVDFAPKNTNGPVEFSGDLLYTSGPKRHRRHVVPYSSKSSIVDVTRHLV